MPARQILHVDMDAFFAAVEQRDNPRLRGRPTLVGRLHRGVVAAASYEARAFGIHSAMPMSQALRRCPSAQVVAPRRAAYVAASRAVFAIFAQYTPLVEGLSLDEAFLDVTGSQALCGSGADIARAIQAEILAKLELTAAAGVAPCKFVAKLASDWRKPGGLTEVAPAQVRAFLAPLPVGRMWGIGAVHAARLREHGVHTLGDLAACEVGRLRPLLGRWAGTARALARGEDDRPVVSMQTAEGMSCETTFASDHQTTATLQPVLLGQALELASRLRALPAGAHLVRVKLKFDDFSQQTRQRVLVEATDDPDGLYAAARTLLGRFVWGGRRVRLCGLGVGQLDPGAPVPGLFVDPLAHRRSAIETARSAIAARFGSRALTRASLVESPPRPGTAGSLPTLSSTPGRRPW